MGPMPLFATPNGALSDSLEMDTVIPALTEGNLTELMARFALALAVGMLVGSERERSTPDHAAPGVRTFAILSLTGAIALAVSPLVLAATLLTAAVVAISPTMRARRKSDDPPGFGATTVAAATAAPLLGALALALPGLAAATAVGLTITLASKERAHAFIRQTVTPTELTDALKFFVISLVVLPLLPDATYGPLDVVNPHKIGYLVTALTGIGWAGYIAMRAFGSTRGLPIAGFAGGFVSSTATTAAMSRRVKEGAPLRPAIAATLLAKVSSLVTMCVLVGALSPATLLLLAWPLGAMVLALLGLSWLYGKDAKSTNRILQRFEGILEEPQFPEEEGPLHMGRPFALEPALILAGVITFALIAAKAAAQRFGDSAVIAVAAITGTADTHAPSLANATLAANGTISPHVAMAAIVAAIITNTALKMALAYIGGGRLIGYHITRTLGLAAAVMATVAIATLQFL